jgi:predicted Zn-dependent protease
MLLSETEAKAICRKALGYVKADDAEVGVRGEKFSHLRFAANEFSTSGYREDVYVDVTVWVGRRKGSASTNELDDASLRALVAEAEELARVSPVDEEYLPTLAAQSYQPVGGFVEGTINLPLDARAKAVGEVIAQCENSGAAGAGFHQARGEVEATATRNGNFLYGRSTLASLSLTARTLEGTGSGYFIRNHFDISKLDTARIGQESVGKALRSRQPRPLEPGVYTVIFEPQAVADLVGLFPSAFDARRADEGRSAFSASGGKTKIGERILDERLSLYSDPWHPELPGPAAASNGVPARKIHLVRNGVLERLVYSRFWAKKQQVDPTPGPVNAILESSAKPVEVEDMIRDTKRGLLIGRFWYIRSIDPRTISYTGLTRDGVWLIDDGKIQHPVQNFRFNQSILELLGPGNVDLIGASERVSRSESQGESAQMMPALKVKKFHLTSVSEAV